MYLHLGQDISVRMKDIVGVFDLETSTISASSRQFLSQAQKEGKVVNVTEEMPKSFILCRSGAVYLSQISPATLARRAAAQKKTFSL